MDLQLGLLLVLLAAVSANLLLTFIRRPTDVSLPLRGLGEAIAAQDQRFREVLSSEMARARQEHNHNRQDLQTHLGDSLDRFGKRQTDVFELVNKQISSLMQGNEQRFERLQASTQEALTKIQGEVSTKLEKIQTDNQQQLERMRETVDEKLNKTLEERLGRSFRLVSQHLEMVQKGLGEMQSLAAGVGDLKRVLSNVKTRGVLGEIQLLNIIDELLTKDQYDTNCITIPGKNCRVEVAIKMPGQQAELSKQLYLPIDSKFPLDRFQQLCHAYESGDLQEIQIKTRDLHRTILQFAKDIRTKYVAPPYTTDFAIMFLPVEGLYAEVSREPELLFRLRSEYQIIVAGPNNLSAFLNALQMGFRTLAIEQRSSEVWTLLSEIKTEFASFGTALDKVQKKLTEASNVIDKAGVRKRAMEKRLSKVEELPMATASKAPADLLLSS